MTEGGGGGAVVVGLGMCAALGTDVATNCAAARAGLSRAAPLEHYRVRSAVEGTPEPAIGHQASLFTRGFEGEPRLVRLAQAALTDLLRQSSGIDWRERRHAFYLSLPDPDRIHTGAELIADDDLRRAWIEAEAVRQQDGPASPPPARHAQAVLAKAARLAAWPAEVSVGAASVTGHAGAMEAIQAALADLASAAIEIAVVLGVESWLDEPTLQWLHVRGRLKCDGAPAGFQPGEAGVAIALSQTVVPSTATRQPWLHGVSVTRERRAQLAGETAAGEALAQVIASVWEDSEQIPWIISDQNGEFYRAMDWGHAVVRLRGQFDAFAEPVVWYPAASFGDVGAASGLAGVCVAARAWERQYAPAAGALVVAASDGGERAAIALSGMRSR